VVHRSMASSLKVSVMTCTYNMGEFIEEAIDSALCQTHPVHEYIIVDDGSTDDTLDRLARFDDPRIRVLRADHGGISRARNLALSHAAGDILCFLDADDRWVPDKVEREVAVFESEPEVGAIFVNFRRFNAKGFFPRDQFEFYPELATIPTRPTAAGGGQIIDADAFSLLIEFEEPPSWLGANSFRTRAVEALKFDVDLAKCEDFHYCFLAYLTTAVAFIPQPLVDVRRHASNATINIGAIPTSSYEALRRLGDAPLSRTQRKALDARVARSLVAFGREAALRGDGLAAFANYVAAIRRRPRWVSLIKQMLLTPSYLLRSRQRVHRDLNQEDSAC
jgi:glycosyltransferase involved in cell wall biosynthesis